MNEVKVDAAKFNFKQMYFPFTAYNVNVANAVGRYNLLSRVRTVYKALMYLKQRAVCSKPIT
jgi:hypothetical protein